MKNKLQLAILILAGALAVLAVSAFDLPPICDPNGVCVPHSR
jgi:hypothetical protein